MLLKFIRRTSNRTHQLQLQLPQTSSLFFDAIFAVNVDLLSPQIFNNAQTTEKTAQNTVKNCKQENWRIRNKKESKNMVPEATIRMASVLILINNQVYFSHRTI
jgi:hypothetical protein